MTVSSASRAQLGWGLSVRSLLAVTIGKAAGRALARTPAGQPIWVVSTSVVLQELRRWLADQGYVKELWRETGAGAWQA
jgi:hypothetical protein